MIESCRPALPKHKSASRPVGPTNGSGFGEKDDKAGIAQLVERRSRKAEAGGLIPPAKHHCPQSIAVMLRSCKAGSLVQVQVRAPIRSLSSFGRAPTWYVGGGRIEACAAHQFRLPSPAAKASGLRPDIRRFESVREHHSSSNHASESEK